MPASDAELLADFALRGSDPRKADQAFSELARRYSSLVFAAARRQTACAAMAEDVTQAVFLVLAKKAGSVPPGRLAGWLLTVTQLCAKDANRGERRRTHHEREAAMSKPEITQPPQEIEPQISAQLDEAMCRLRGRDSTALALRFLQDKPLSEVASALNVSPNAAQKIVARALVRLRKILVKRGVSAPSTAILSTVLLKEATHVAPASLAISHSTTAAAPLAIAKGASQMLLASKIKIAGAVAAATLLVSGASTVVVMRSLAQTQAMADSAQPVVAAPAQDASAPAAPAAGSVALYESPFLELVGCRIKQWIPVKLSGTPTEQATVTGVANQYAELDWTTDPAIANNVASYSIAVTPTNDPAGAQTIRADKSATSQPLLDIVSEPGEYDVTLTAIGADSKPLASAAAHLTINQMPITQIMIEDIQPDGAIAFATIMQNMNQSGRTLMHDGFINSDFVHVEKITNDQGQPMRFTQSHQGSSYRYQVTLSPPVQAGDPMMSADIGTESGIIKNLGGGLFSYSFTHWPNTSTPCRRIELYRLPEGATLIFATPNLKSRMVDGRVQIYMETMIPAGGSNRVMFRYRVPVVTH